MLRSTNALNDHAKITNINAIGDNVFRIYPEYIFKPAIDMNELQ